MKSYLHREFGNRLGHMPCHTSQKANFLSSYNFVVVFTFLIRKSPNSYSSTSIAIFNTFDSFSF